MSTFLLDRIQHFNDTRQILIYNEGMKKLAILFGSLSIVLVFVLTPLKFDILNASWSNLIMGPNIGFGVSHAGARNWFVDGTLNALVTLWILIIYDLTQVIVVFSGWFLDFFLKHSIESTSYRTGMIESGWEIIRNLVNIGFIFALLIIAFEKVFGSTKSNTNKRLIKTILIALVINFSLYGVYLVVDSSNILAHLFYNRITVEGKNAAINNGGDLSFVNDLFDSEVKSVSTAVVSHINPQRIVSFSPTGVVLTPEMKFVIYSLAGFLNIILLIVFFSAGLVFLSRTIGIVILGVLAPLAFVTLVIPGTEKYPYIGFDKWLSQLLGLAFTAPIFLFFLYIIVQFASNRSFMGNINTGLESGSVLTTILAVVLPFAFIAVLLMIAKKVTNQLAGELGGMISGAVTKAVTGAAAVGAIALTGGMAMGGGVLRGMGSIAGQVKGGEGTSRFLTGLGKGAQSVKFDLTRIPGFKGQMDKLGTGGKMLTTGMQTNYADVSSAAHQGINKVKMITDDVLTGKTPAFVKKWDDNVNASRDAYTKNQVENAERVAREKAIFAAGDTQRVEIYTNPSTGKKTPRLLSETTHTKEGLLKEKKAKFARMTEEEKKEERDAIRELTSDKNEEMALVAKDLKNATNVTDRKMLQEKIAGIKKDIEKIQNSSTEGAISFIEKELKKTANDAKAKVLKGKSDKEAARFANGAPAGNP